MRRRGPLRVRPRARRRTPRHWRRRPWRAGPAARGTRAATAATAVAKRSAPATGSTVAPGAAAASATSKRRDDCRRRRRRPRPRRGGCARAPSRWPRAARQARRGGTGPSSRAATAPGRQRVGGTRGRTRRRRPRRPARTAPRTAAPPSRSGPHHRAGRSLLHRTPTRASAPTSAGRRRGRHARPGSPRVEQEVDLRRVLPAARSSASQLLARTAPARRTAPAPTRRRASAGTRYGCTCST